MYAASSSSHACLSRKLDSEGVLKLNDTLNPRQGRELEAELIPLELE
jgi:hypothetical protein